MVGFNVVMFVVGFDLGEVESESLSVGLWGHPRDHCSCPDPTTNGTDKHRNGKETKLRNAQTCSAWLLIDYMPLKTIDILSQNKSSPEVG